MKWWPTLLFGLAAFFFFANFAPKQEREIELLDNGCAIYSISLKQAIEGKSLLTGDNIWVRVLAIHFYNKTGHAVTVFVYKNNTYVYDPNIGTYPIARYPIYDPLTIAEISFPDEKIEQVHFLEPTFLLHYQERSSRLMY